MSKQKITLVGCGGEVLTTCENCSPFDILSLLMSSLEGLVESGIVPLPIARAGLDALSAQLSSPPPGE